MNGTGARALYALLPAIYRARDVRPDGTSLDAAKSDDDNRPFPPLYALISVIAEQAALVSGEIDQLYDNAFIETCADWVIPYIGDLIGYRPLGDAPALISSPRVDVANTIGYRRRKGTVTVLERLARDVSGWPAVAVEFFRLLATTERMNHVRRTPTFTAGVRAAERAASTGSPFDVNAHLVEVRRIASGRGRYDIPNVGVFAWRLGAAFVAAADAARAGDGLYTFDPLGRDAQLVNVPVPFARDDLAPAAPHNLPLPIGRRMLGDALAAPAGSSVLASFTVRNAAGSVLSPDKIQVANLSDWLTARPPMVLPVVASVDPVLGRIDLGAGVPAGAHVLVDYAIASPGSYGAGPFVRSDAVAPTHAVGRTNLNAPAETFSTAITNALGSPIVSGGKKFAVLELAESFTEPDAANVTLADGDRLTIRAKSGERAVVLGTLTLAVSGTTSLHLEGLLLAGGIVLGGSGTCNVTLAECTVRAITGKTDAMAWSGADGTLAIARSLLAPVSIPENPDGTLAVSVHVSVTDSVIAAAGDTKPALVAPFVDVARSTVAGTLAAHAIGTIENAIVTGDVTADRTQSGCCRFSYVTRTSTAARRFRCQPDGAAQAAMEAAAAANPALTPAQLVTVGDQAAQRVLPVFESLDDGDPAYAMLSAWCAPEIRTGADDGGEMGAYHDLYLSQREANLRTRLAEYLGIGLETGVLYAS